MAQTTCSNDISLLYPWLHISDTLLDIKTWLRRQTNRITSRMSTPPPPLLSGSLGRHGKLETPTVANMRIVQVIVRFPPSRIKELHHRNVFLCTKLNLTVANCSCCQNLDISDTNKTLFLHQ